MEESRFVKLSSLIDQDFTVKKVSGFCWKKWDAQNNKMLVSDTYKEGYRKLWQVVTDKGQLDLGDGQMGNLLVGALRSSGADIRNCTFHVKSNGKTGMDIRYYLNPVHIATPAVEEVFGNEEGW